MRRFAGRLLLAAAGLAAFAAAGWWILASPAPCLRNVGGDANPCRCTARIEP